jgi:hypothetical protein
MDFEPVGGLEMHGYRIASIDHITPSSTSGDAYIVCPDGRRIDLAWKSDQPEPSATWSPPTMPESLGVISVRITERVDADGDMMPVLAAAVALMETILASGVEPPR